MSKQKNRNGSKNEIERNTISVKAPFKLEKDDQRRFIRLEIIDPLNYSVLKNRSGGFWPDGDGPSYTGSILNISAGGLLIISDGALEEGSLVIIKLSLQGVEIIKNVIGIVKRVEQDENDWLVGIEFITRETLTDRLTSAEFDLIPKDVASFNEHLRGILNNYVQQKQITKEGS